VRRLVTHVETQLSKESGDVIHHVCKHGSLTISQLIHEVCFARMRARRPDDQGRGVEHRVADARSSVGTWRAHSPHTRARTTHARSG
jgi:hypothetical protein